MSIPERSPMRYRKARKRVVEGGEAWAVIWYRSGEPTAIHLIEKRGVATTLCGKTIPRTVKILGPDDDQTRGRCKPCDLTGRAYSLKVRTL